MDIWVTNAEKWPNWSQKLVRARFFWQKSQKSEGLFGFGHFGALFGQKGALSIDFGHFGPNLVSIFGPKMGSQSGVRPFWAPFLWPKRALFGGPLWGGLRFWANFGPKSGAQIFGLQNLISIFWAPKYGLHILGPFWALFGA